MGQPGAQALPLSYTAQQEAGHRARSLAALLPEAAQTQTVQPLGPPELWEVQSPCLVPIELLLASLLGENEAGTGLPKEML